MRVMGIDPGTLVMGFGIIDSQGDCSVSVKYGALETDSRSPIGERLSFLYAGLIALISEYKPDVVAVEQPFVAKNARSAFAVGRAQAVAILAASNNKLPCFEYSPREVKQKVTSYGASDKEQVQRMVMYHLDLSEFPEPTDAADALAVALCHVQCAHMENLLNQ